MDYVEKLYHADIDGSKIGDLRLFCCGCRTDAPDHSFGPAARDNYWFIFLKEGSGIYEVNRKQYRIEKNTVFIAFPNRRIYYRADPGSVWTIRWISIGPEFLESYLSSMKVTEDNPVLPVTSPLAMENVLQSLLEEVPEETLVSKLRCVGLVYQFLSLLTAPPASPAVRRDYVDEALFFIYNNYDRPITAKDIAASVRLDPAYFSRLFRNRIGISPAEWLTRYRMDKALGLLRTTDLKISEIARSVGFSDPLYFSRCFSARCGCSPAAWRREHGMELLEIEYK